MRKKIDIVIITNIPSFYKIKLYNGIAKFKKIQVLFWSAGMNNRTDDFYDEQIEFPYYIVAEKNMLLRYLYILRFIKSIEYSKLIISGWDTLYCWFAAFISAKKYNAVVVESSYFESTVFGIKALLKKIFLSRFSLAFVPGESNKRLLELLLFKGNIIKTFGVGLYNRVRTPIFEERQMIKNFLYVGRLSPEKNLFFLIRAFNRLSNKFLNIAGYGPLEQELRGLAKENIRFLGEIKNKELQKIYRENDVLVLPSLSEPWGLVVEEALNNGIPVIVNNKVGCINEIVLDGWNGIIFDSTEESFMDAVHTISESKKYNLLRKNVCAFDYEERERMQIDAYL